MKITCPVCDGKGEHDNLDYTIRGCSACGGKSGYEKGFFGGHKWVSQKGSGKITVSGNPCSACDGRGRVKVNPNSIKYHSCYQCSGTGYELPR